MLLALETGLELAPPIVLQFPFQANAPGQRVVSSRGPRPEFCPCNSGCLWSRDRQVPSFAHFFCLDVVSREIPSQRGVQPRPSSHPRTEMNLLFLLHHPQHTAPRRVAECIGYSVPGNPRLPEPLKVVIGSFHFSPKQVTQNT